MKYAKKKMAEKNGRKKLRSEVLSVKQKKKKKKC